MAVLDVKCYFNTGFSAGNIPSSPAVLEKATSKSFPEVWKLQSQGLAKIKIKADWEEISQVDYVKLGTAYYTVDSIQMLNGSVAVLNLRQDPINTVGGITEFSILDGWATRVHAQTDNLFQNIVTEPWQPRQQLKNDAPVQMGTGDYGTGSVIIGTTVDIISNTNVARQYYAATSEGAADTSNPLIAVPQVKSVKNNTSLVIEPDTSGENGWDGYQINSQSTPASALYDFSVEGVPVGVESLRALGLENAITASFFAPKEYFSIEFDSTGRITTLKNKVKVYNSGLPYKYGTYQCKNNKVYAMFNTFNVVSTGSGAQMSFEARELYSGGSAPAFLVFADPSPNGCPYCQPSWFDGKKTAPFQNCLQGAPWLNVPVTFERASNYLQTRAQYIRTSEDIKMAGKEAVSQLGFATLDLLMGAGSGQEKLVQDFTSPKSDMSFGDYQNASAQGFIGNLYNWSKSAVSAGFTGARLSRELARNTFDYQANVSVAEPGIYFPQSPSIQGYVGNGFLLYRTHLSEADMVAFDNFLTAYGYANSRRLLQEDLSSRKCFNFVQANNVAIGGPKAMWLREAIASYFEAGVRLWHELPNTAAMTDNPIKTSTASEVSD